MCGPVPGLYACCSLSTQFTQNTRYVDRGERTIKPAHSISGEHAAAPQPRQQYLAIKKSGHCIDP